MRDSYKLDAWQNVGEVVCLKLLNLSGVSISMLLIKHKTLEE